MFQFQLDPITDLGVSCPLASENLYKFYSDELADTQNWRNILSVFEFIHAQVQSYLALRIVNFGISKHYAGCQVSDRCPLGYLFVFCTVMLCIIEFYNYLAEAERESWLPTLTLCLLDNVHTYLSSAFFF